MNRKDMLVTCVIALGTMTVLLSAFKLARPTDAGDGTEAPQQVLSHNGMQLSLSLKRHDYKAGEKPEVALKAVNTTDHPVTLKANIMMQDTTVVVESRIGPRPQTMWRQECSIALKPNETKTVDLMVDAALKPGSEVRFALYAESDSLPIAAQLSVPLPAGAQLSMAPPQSASLPQPAAEKIAPNLSLGGIRAPARTQVLQ